MPSAEGTKKSDCQKMTLLKYLWGFIDLNGTFSEKNLAIVPCSIPHLPDWKFELNKGRLITDRASVQRQWRLSTFSKKIVGTTANNFSSSLLLCTAESGNTHRNGSPKKCFSQ